LGFFRSRPSTIGSVEKPERVIADVGARVAEIRRANRWTQQDLADRLRMEPQSVQRIERGTNLTIRNLVRLARVLGVTTAALFEQPSSSERRPGRPKKTAPPR
jgi:transcriptional regulator with XRE-family HTH domain